MTTTADVILPGLDEPYAGIDLVALAQLVERDAHLRWCWHVLAFNSGSTFIRTACERDLRAALATKAAA